MSTMIKKDSKKSSCLLPFSITNILNVKESTELKQQVTPAETTPTKTIKKKRSNKHGKSDSYPNANQKSKRASAKNAENLDESKYLPKYNLVVQFNGLKIKFVYVSSNKL